MKTRLFALSLAALLLPPAADAQLITVRTMPMAQADQFDVFPSLNLGMGGASIALADSLLDPFRNPARGSRLSGGRIFSAPTVFNVSSQSGGGRTLPIGALLRAGQWFGGGVIAIQEIEPGRRPSFFSPPILEGDVLPGVPGGAGFAPDTTPDTRAHANALGTLVLGRRINGLALGSSVMIARVGAMDGVDMLYNGSTRVAQQGQVVDARLGLLRDVTDDQSFELVALYHAVRMRHDVTFVDLQWDPATQSPVGVARAERNHEHTTTVGLHAGYQRPLPGTDWRIGGVVTANHMEHPRVPRYDVMNLPADPGSSDALNLGIGLSRQRGSETFGLDFVYEPMRSHTRSEADPGADPALAPARTDNRFRFSNALVRMGFGWDLDPGSRDRGASMQLGLVVRAVRYRLDQQDLATGATRALADAWTEWSPTWGLGLTMPTFQLRYRGRLSNGTRRPVSAQSGGICCAIPIDNFGGFFPSTTPAINDVHVLTHQITLSLPLR